MSPDDDFFQVPLTSDPSAPVAAQVVELRGFLNSSNPNWHGYDLAANPYPFYASHKRLAEIQQINSALHTAVLAIIGNWWSTPRYQSAIPLSPKIERVLRSLESRRPYNNIGTYRPDFLIPLHQNEPISFCEINARFAFNAFIQSSYMQDYVARLETGDIKGFKRSATESILSAFSELFDETKPLGLVKGRETGLDIHLFHHFHSHSRFINPSDLKLVPCSNSPSGLTLADNFGSVEQIALELHQDELEALEEQLLLEVGARCYNDLRTIFLMHDKRMLGLLLQELDNLVSSTVLTAVQADALRSGIAETHLPGTRKFQSILDDVHNRHMWLLKPSLVGKGEGIVFGKDVSEGTWKTIIKSEETLPGSLTSASISYVFQRYFVQRRHKLIVKPQEPSQSPRRVNWFVVGNVLSLNKHFLGVAGWRTSATDITAVSRGGEYMAGVTDSAACIAFPRTFRRNQSVPNPSPSLQIPRTARLKADSLDHLPDHVPIIKDALQMYGVAAIHLGFPDPDSTYMLNLARALGTLVDHSNTNDPLWDVKAKSGSDLARSQTANSFPWHTDCSFDKSPPRYFALHVIHSDQKGGGKLKVLPVDKILSTLRPLTVEILKRPVFRMRVPREFQKDLTHVTGALLTSDAKIRYRREIIEPLNAEAGQALEELDSVLRSSEDEGLARVLGKDIMRDGTIVCLDNAKWMHARSQVRDPQRWLRRVRWGPEEF